jgi:hypothetical protein
LWKHHSFAVEDILGLPDKQLVMDLPAVVERWIGADNSAVRETKVVETDLMDQGCTAMVECNPELVASLNEIGCLGRGCKKIDSGGEK